MVLYIILPKRYLYTRRSTKLFAKTFKKKGVLVEVISQKGLKNGYFFRVVFCVETFLKFKKSFVKIVFFQNVKNKSCNKKNEKDFKIKNIVIPRFYII